MVKNIIALFPLAVSEEYFTSSEFEKGHTHIKSVHAAKKHILICSKDESETLKGIIQLF